jgi:hypothetical protein
MRRGVIAREVADAFLYDRFGMAYGWAESQVDATSDALLMQLDILIDERTRIEQEELKRKK